MNKLSKKEDGFTLVELIVASTLLAIVVTGVFASFLAASRLTAYIRHDMESFDEAQRWLARVGSGSTYDELTATVSADDNFVFIYDASSPFLEDYRAGATRWNLNDKVDNLEVKYRITENVVLDAGTGSGVFKQIELRVTWDERTL